jgi:hypothetical protein
MEFSLHTALIILHVPNISLNSYLGSSVFSLFGYISKSIQLLLLLYY